MPSTDKTLYAEIDFRAVIRTLLRYRWQIAGFTLAAAVVTLGGSLLWPKRYRATAQLVITPPIISTTLSDGVQLTPTAPESKGLRDFALAADLLQTLRTKAQQASLIPSTLTQEAFRRRLRATVVGDSQMLLQATDDDKEQAARLAEMWARELADRLNLLYGVDKAALDRIESQAAQARDTWASAETELTNFLARTRLETLRVQVGQRREMLTTYLNKILGIDLLISDAQAMEAAFLERGDTERMPVGAAMGLMDLQRRAAGGTAGLQFQISGSSVVAEDSTIAEARRTLKQMIRSLQAQRTELASRLKKIEDEISTLTAELESADYQFARLILKRDLSRRAYDALAGQAAGTRIALTHNGATAKLAGPVAPPDRPLRPRPLRDTVIGTVVGLLLSVFGVIGVEWWRR